LRLNNKPQAITFFQTAVTDAEPKSVLAQIAKEDLELAQADKGRLIVAGAAGGELQVLVKQDDTVVTTLQTAGETHVDLPAGSYQLSFETGPGDAPPCQQDVNLLVGGRQRIQVPKR